MSPVFAHGHLRLYILSLLDESPRHGYELIQALSDRFGGTYSPSAGTIYPRLAKLEDEGLVTKTSDGRKSVYSITEAGRAELASRAEELAGIETGVTESIRALADEVRSDVDLAMKSLRVELAAAARAGRSAATTSGTVATTGDTAKDAAVEMRIAVRDLEASLTTVRSEVRTTVRKRAASGAIDLARVHRFRAELDELAREFLDDLRAS